MRFQTLCLVVFVTTVFGDDVDNDTLVTFPDDFKLGKGPNIWDTLTHERPHLVVDRSTGDVADDSYHLYLEDVRLLKDMGVKVYRFSISWARILPEGHDNNVNEAGIEYYNKLIDALLRNGIEPMVTMYHWDLPQKLQDLGGWPNRILAKYAENYARVLFSNFGDRVKQWLTFNEPLTFMDAYASDTGMAPSVDTPGIGDYLTAHTVILAHANIYRLYEREFREEQQGQVGIALNIHWCEPETGSPKDVEACERYQQFNLGIYAHPIFSENGDYPSVLKARVDANSASEGYTTSRLPKFTPEEVAFVNGTYDFLGLNFYTAVVGRDGVEGEPPSRYRDMGTITSQDPEWPESASSWLRVVPWGFRKELNWIANEYGNPPIFITENGFSDYGGVNDTNRVLYYTSRNPFLSILCSKDTCYFSERFGIHAVNFIDPSRPRTPKESARVLTEIFKTRQIPERFRD
ncbi:hypothetical protein Cfor_08132 [Coptotermes formosanus]|uniref:beta-glucosidase n=1 Tax=Coptotermes formosanus TaxID=36987 RepID=A0A6L2PD71_COPFO|nr:hypothetical protein Cfor_08132 [Coptotermes formosanus]